MYIALLMQISNGKLRRHPGLILSKSDTKENILLICVLLIYDTFYHYLFIRIEFYLVIKCVKQLCKGQETGAVV